MVVKAESAINGPKGIISFLLFFLSNNKGKVNMAPIKNDRKTTVIIFSNPRKKPSIPISFISPPPIPPSKIIAINRKKPPPINSPKTLSDHKIFDFKNNDKRSLYIKFVIKPNIMSPSGITVCL